MIKVLSVLVVLMVLGGCLVAFFTFGKIEKDMEKEVAKLVKKKYE